MFIESIDIQIYYILFKYKASLYQSILHQQLLLIHFFMKQH